LSVLKNIWRPENPPRKNAGPNADSVLTERLAELLGRELEELQETESAKKKKNPAPSPSSQSPAAERPAPGRIEQPERSFRSVSSQDSQLAAKSPDPDTIEDFEIPSSPRQAYGTDDSVRVAADEAILQLRALEEQIETKLRGRAEDYAQALDTAITGLDRGPEPGKTTDEATQQFRAEARGWFDEARRELREQLEMSRNSLESELKRGHEELLEAAKQKIDSLARASLESSEQAAKQHGREQTDRWLKEQAENSQRHAEAAAQNLAAATEQALARLAAFEERIEAGFRSQVEEYRRVVESASSQLEQKGISQANFQQAAEELHRLTDQALDRSTKRIEEHAEQSMARLSQKLSTVEQSLAGAARAAMEGALLEQQHRLSQAWIEKSRAAAETVAQVGREGQARLEAARNAAEQEFRNALLEHSQKTLEEATAGLKNSGFQEQLLADVSGRMEQAARDVVARSAADLNKQSEAAISSLSGALNDTAERFLAEVQGRLNQAGRAWFESAGQSAQKEYQARITQWLDGQARTTQQRAEEAERAVLRLTDQASTRLELISREAEASLRARVQEQQQKWLESALEEARQSGFERKVIDQALSQMETRATQLLDQASKRLAEHADATRATISAELDSSTKKLLEGAEASLEHISWQHRGRLAQWWEERNQAARRESESAAAALTQASQQAVNQLRSVQSDIAAELSSRAREHQSKLLDGAMEEMRRNGAIDRAVSEAASTLRAKANDLLNRSAEQIREQADSARTILEKQAQGARWELGEELAKKVEQAQSSVEAAGKAVTEDYRRELAVWWEERAESARREKEEAAESVSRSAKQASQQLEKARDEMESAIQAGLQNYRKGLREAAAEELRRQGFQKDMLESISAELDKSSKELAERSTRELQRHVESSLTGLDEKLKSARQSFFDDTQKQLAELSRSTMDMTTSRFHELLTRNVQDLEKEQEEWLQRKRESVWLDINQRSSASAGASKPNSRSMSILGSAEDQKPAPAGAGVIGKLALGAGVIAVAAVLTLVFVRLAPQLAPQKTVVMQLPTDPPAGFIAQNPRWGPLERARQIQLGQAYWLLAVNDLEHEYPYNSQLPATPPPEFRVNSGGLQDDMATRMAYWNKLQQLWKTRSDWQQVSENTGGEFSQAISWIKTKLTEPQTGSSSSSVQN
jgi:hypothetical protein